MFVCFVLHQNEADAREGGEAFMNRRKGERMLEELEGQLARVAKEKHVQPRRRLEVQHAANPSISLLFWVALL